MLQKVFAVCTYHLGRLISRDIRNCEKYSCRECMIEHCTSGSAAMCLAFGTGHRLAVHLSSRPHQATLRQATTMSHPKNNTVRS